MKYGSEVMISGIGIGTAELTIRLLFLHGKENVVRNGQSLSVLGYLNISLLD
jgi:hypothetical protein